MKKEIKKEKIIEILKRYFQAEWEAYQPPANRKESWDKQSLEYFADQILELSEK